VLQEQWHPLTDELHHGKEHLYIEKSPNDSSCVVLLVVVAVVVVVVVVVV